MRHPAQGANEAPKVKAARTIYLTRRIDTSFPRDFTKKSFRGMTGGSRRPATSASTDAIPRTPHWLPAPTQADIPHQLRLIRVPHHVSKLVTETVEEFAYRCWWERQCGYPIGKKPSEIMRPFSPGLTPIDPPASSGTTLSPSSPPQFPFSSRSPKVPRSPRVSASPRSPSLSFPKSPRGGRASPLGGDNVDPPFRATNSSSTEHRHVMPGEKPAAQPPMLIRQKQGKGKGHRGSFSDPAGPSVIPLCGPITLPTRQVSGAAPGERRLPTSIASPLDKGERAFTVMDLVGEDVPVEAAAHGRWGENALGWNTVWSPMHKAKGVEITAGGACAKLVSDGYMPRPRELGGMSDAEYGSVRGVRAIPRKGSTYFEVMLEGGGDLAAGDGLGGGYFIGLCTDDLVAFDCRPERGFKGRHAVWAVGDSSGRPRGIVRSGGQNSVEWVVGSGYGHKDVMGVLVNMEARRLTFYKNGVKLGDAPPPAIPEVVYPLVTLVNKGVKATLICPQLHPSILYADYGGIAFFQMNVEAIKKPHKASKRTTRSAVEPPQSPMKGVRDVGPLPPEVMSSFLHHMPPSHLLSSGKMIKCIPPSPVPGVKGGWAVGASGASSGVSDADVMRLLRKATPIDKSL